MNLVTADTIPSNPSHAVFGGGCFWCMEAIFRNQPGVISVISGFAGGTTKKPSYKEVCTGQTGHAEVIQITYDPKKVSYTQLLSLFWRAHDPTTLNRQGADQGPQYRSIILTTSSEQMTEAQASKKKLEAELNKSITTEIKPLITFTPADKEHQDYYFNNQQAPYCRAVIAPKLKKLSLE
ncbi:MAG: peptide-methionine (S)-S-oxide reductase [Verrucomicrobia bacterium RIFCSPHIGHO2_12_FULL_41_10]|nr:MAG: peptide-methionine (S)-S-oxide reductase [Verrucomicrobia bacterium RIFCSPHIGHO2_12_FULL_41_10]HLB34662.1 peptide-methionine (S)-S-oxide reductase MsrA [Chthoniobacterales bacterium]